jgi:hypothetical protein
MSADTSFPKQATSVSSSHSQVGVLRQTISGEVKDFMGSVKETVEEFREAGRADTSGLGAIPAPVEAGREQVEFSESTELRRTLAEPSASLALSPTGDRVADLQGEWSGHKLFGAGFEARAA